MFWKENLTVNGQGTAEKRWVYEAFVVLDVLDLDELRHFGELQVLASGAAYPAKYLEDVLQVNRLQRVLGLGEVGLEVVGLALRQPVGVLGLHDDPVGVGLGLGLADDLILEVVLLIDHCDQRFLERQRGRLYKIAKQ